MKKFSESSGPLNDEASQTQVIQDILHSRNDHLVGEIQSSLKDYRRIIIPWGALHLTGVESGCARMISCNRERRSARQSVFGDPPAGKTRRRSGE